MKVSIIAVNYGAEEREKELKDFLTRTIQSQGIEVMETPDTDDVTEIVEAALMADKVILVYDSLIRLNPNLTIAVREISNKNIRPILIVTNSENDDFYDAHNLIGDLWGKFEPSKRNWQNSFGIFFFSYDKMMLGLTPKVSEANTEGLIKEILQVEKDYI